MDLHITENKSKGAQRPGARVVRVFVDNDYHYGYFIREDALFALLDDDQRQAYLQGDEARLSVPPQVAQQIIDMGTTPYRKARVA